MAGRSVCRCTSCRCTCCTPRFSVRPSLPGFAKRRRHVRAKTVNVRTMTGDRGLLDRYGRRATDLRVSLTDRCNLRCTYCMPPEGLPWLPKDEILTDAEIVRLIGVAVCELGVTEVRFTGGEPLLRPGLVEIIRSAAALLPRPRLSLTTNAIGLERLAPGLKEAGLDRVNVSLDTLDPDRFERLAHRRRFDDTLRGLHAAAEAGLTPVKIN